MTASLAPWVAAAVLVAGALGAVARFALSRALPVRPGRLPWGILIANVGGSAVAGLVIGLAERAALGDDVRLILVTGFCGGLTTFSTWSVESIELAATGRWRAAALNVGATFAFGLVACAVAYLLAR
ncbi:fluoride efflux transporter CrcB [Agromyces sp. CFH 90414]|uniref:Fluoride-specific ion channel FluC n=1 Tax=Agromyces agglutinans TaxID=2662258 RepID=A0A6I2F1I4_9MICO|nr:fluoride efflux transporter CrcB [Agromyces agglutinans]MRG59335.1 fluoride efflux transporter CrcB [Agromyces agglutinans]